MESFLHQAVKLVLDVVLGLVTYSLLLRFLMQTMRAPFRNPLGQSVIALTDWLVKPLRRVIPGVKGLDWATLAGALLVQAAWLGAVFMLFGAGFDVLSANAAIYLVLLALLKLFQALLWILIVAVIVQAILSWTAPDGPLAGVLNALTFPLLRPLRRWIPPLGGTIDITPVIVIVVAQLALLALAHLEPTLLHLAF